MRDYGDIIVQAAVESGHSLTWPETKRGIDMLEAAPKRDLKSALAIVKKISAERKKKAS